eukprot:10388247-Alexandrium_andersonii.AAC.1
MSHTPFAVGAMGRRAFQRVAAGGFGWLSCSRLVCRGSLVPAPHGLRAPLARCGVLGGSASPSWA